MKKNKVSKQLALSALVICLLTIMIGTPSVNAQLQDLQKTSKPLKSIEVNNITFVNPQSINGSWTIKSPILTNSNYVFTLPLTTGTAGQYLMTNGIASTSWGNPDDKYVKLNPLLGDETGGYLDDKIQFGSGFLNAISGMPTNRYMQVNLNPVLSNIQQIKMTDKNSNIELAGMKSSIVASGVDSFIRVGKYVLEGYQAVFSGNSAQIAVYADGAGSSTTLNLYADRNKASLGTIENKPLTIIVGNSDRIVINTTKTIMLTDLCFSNGWCLTPSGANMGFKNPSGKIVTEITPVGKVIGTK